jgi:exonuclease SbcD
MKIAITADLHLTSRDDHPERYNALRNILDQILEEKVGCLIITGDLFDTSLKNYSDFEELCTQEVYKRLQIYIIPGNHDADLDDSSIVAENVHVLSQPTILELDPEGPCFFMVPYAEGKTMGEFLEAEVVSLHTRPWILIGHGDWSQGLREQNPYEPGVYMPLTTKDIHRYQPKRVFLGHIHAPMDQDRVHYVGSPCGLDISECGKRRYLIYDTESDDVEVNFVDTDVLFFDESFVMLPVEDEKAYIKNAIKQRIQSWDLTKAEKRKVRVRVRVRGFCTDRKKLVSWIKTSFRYYTSYKNEPPDVSEVSIGGGEDLHHIAKQVQDRIEQLIWREGNDEPTAEDILLAALNVIYRG